MSALAQTYGAYPVLIRSFIGHIGHEQRVWTQTGTIQLRSFSTFRFLPEQPFIISPTILPLVDEGDVEYRLESLILNPFESLEIECKDWIDPDQPEGKAKIVKACLALWNSNGGYLVIGIRKDSTDNRLKPNTSPPYDPRRQFDGDKISQLVADYAFRKFEVIVDFVKLEGAEFPILKVPAGVRIPNVARKSITQNSNPSKELLRADVVYVRTLEANGSVSTAEAKRNDWERIAGICFENREADIGAFMRRHLSQQNLHAIGQFFSAEGSIRQGSPSLAPGPISFGTLEKGAERFSTAITERNLKLPDHGSFEVAFVLPDGVSGFTANQSFLKLLAASNPDYWSWPLWMDSSRFDDADVKPQVRDDSWEACMVMINEEKWTYKAIDFWRANPIGSFYHRRAFWDDMKMMFATTPAPMTVLDPYIQMCHVAESLVIGQAFAKAMGYSKEAPIDFSFRWRRLGKRKLSAWLNPNRLFIEQLTSADEDAKSNIFLPVDTAPSAIFQYVHSATMPLFRVFNGYEFSESVVEQAVNKFLTQGNR